MEQEKPDAPSFDQWAVVELMGHNQIAGRVTEQSIAGTVLLRVDVPEQPARLKKESWDTDKPLIPAYTRYFGGAAIYSITPCTEEMAKMAAESMRKQPPIAFSGLRPALSYNDEDNYR